MNLSSEEARIFAQNIIDTVREALIVLDEDLRVVSASRSFYRLFQVAPDQTEGQLIYELGNHQWDNPKLRELLQSIIPSQATIEDFEVQHNFKTIGEKVMLLNARRIVREHGKAGLILLAIEDITERSAIEQQLTNSEMKYRKFVEEINSIIIGFNREGNITFFNHFSEKLFGYERYEVIGKPLVGTIIPFIDSTGRDDNTRINEEIFIDPARYYANESEGLGKDGRRIFFSWSAKAVRDPDGTVTEILIDGNDITDLKRKRKEAGENSAILDSLLNSIPEGIMITDAKNVVRKVSRYAGELFNIPAEKLLDTDEQQRLEIMKLYWSNGNKIKPDDLPLFKSAITGKTITDYEFVSRNDGKVKILSASAAPVRDSHGIIVGAIGAWRDVTSLRRSMEEVEQRKRVLDSLLEYAPIGIMLVDREGVITDVSRFLTELLHIPEKELVGKEEQPEQWQLLEPSSRKALHYHFMPLCKAIRKQIVVRDQEFVLVRGIEERVVALSAAPVYDSDGNVIGGVTTWRDITESKRMLGAITDLAKFPEESPYPILRLTKEGIVLYGNKASEELLKEWQCHIDSKVPEHWLGMVKEVASSGTSKALETQCGDRILWLNIIPIVEQDYINIYAYDITERRAAEEALMETLNKAEVGDRMLNALMENVPEGISISDPEGNIHRVSKHGQELLGGFHSGMSIQEVVNSWPVFRPDGKTVMANDELPLVRALRGEAVQDIEILEVDSKGHKLPLLCNAAPIRNAE